MEGRYAEAQLTAAMDGLEGEEPTQLDTKKQTLEREEEEMETLFKDCQTWMMNCLRYILRRGRRCGAKREPKATTPTI